MRGRKGQFYLIAAIIIISIVAGFISLSNYSKRTTSYKICDLKEELGIESQNVLAYGTAQGEDLDEVLERFIEDYVKYKGSGKNLYFLFGDTESITIKAYQTIEETVLLGGEPVTITDGEGEKTYTPSEGIIIMVVEDIEYQFNLAAGENFYFVVSQEIEGERYVITS